MTCRGLRKLRECMEHDGLDETDLVCSFALVGPGISIATARALIAGELVPGAELRETIDRWCAREHSLRQRWPHRSIPASDWWDPTPEAA